MKKQGGFTLLEVLIALALSAVVLSALYGSFFLAQKAVRGVDDSLLRLHELRAAMDIMRREIEAVSENKALDVRPFVLKDRDYYGRQTSEVVFTTVGSALAVLSTVSYQAEEEGGGLVLSKTIGLAWGKSGAGAPVLENIESFSVEVKEGDAWLKTWNRPEMPEEIRVTITLPSGNQGVKPFSYSETFRPKIGRPL